MPIKGKVCIPFSGKGKVRIILFLKNKVCIALSMKVKVGIALFIKRKIYIAFSMDKVCVALFIKCKVCISLSTKGNKVSFIGDGYDLHSFMRRSDEAFSLVMDMIFITILRKRWMFVP